MRSEKLFVSGLQDLGTTRERARGQLRSGESWDSRSRSISIASKKDSLEGGHFRFRQRDNLLRVGVFVQSEKKERTIPGHDVMVVCELEDGR